MSDKTVGLERNLGGEINRIMNDRTDADLRGIVNAEDYILFLELKEYAELKGKGELLKERFRIMERRIFAEQYDNVGRIIHDDISKMARVVGHKSRDPDQKSPFEKGLEY